MSIKFTVIYKFILNMIGIKIGLLQASHFTLHTKDWALKLCSNRVAYTEITMESLHKDSKVISNEAAGSRVN